MSLYNACVSFSFYCERLRSCINEPARYFLTKSPRKLLFNINIFVTVLTLVLSGFSMYVSTLIYDRSFIGGWADFVGVSIVSFAIALTCITGARGSHIVSLELLLGYFWLVVVFIGPLILGVVIALTFTRYIDVYFLHQWTEPNFSKIRDLFCHEYSDTKCLVPLSITTNLEAVNNTYCDYQTDCVTVRDSAINQAIKYGTELTISQASLCLLVLLLLGWAMYTCQFIVTSAVITQSMNDYINYLLLLSIGSSAGLAYYMWWLNEFKGGTFDYGWIPSLFIAMSIAQTVAIPFGIYAGRSKSRVLLTIYIIFVFLIASGFAATGVLGLIIASISTSIISPGYVY